MLARTIKSNQPIVLFIILLIGTALWLFSIIHPVEVSSGAFNMPLYKSIANLLSGSKYLPVIMGYILIIIQGLLLIGFNKKFILISSRTYLPAFFYVLLSSSFIPSQGINPILVGGFFLFFALDFIYRTYRTDYALNEIYLSGFFTALAALFWISFLYYFVLLFIALIILRTFSLREWTVALLGFLTPIFFVFVYYFVFNSDEGYILFNSVFNELLRKETFIKLNYAYLIFYILVSLLLILSSFKVISTYQNKKIKTRKYFEINWWFFLIGLLVFFILKRNTIEIFYLLTIPLSFLFTEYFYSFRKNWYLNTILVLIYGCLLYIQIKAHF